MSNKQRLTPRKREIVLLLSEGLTPKEVADNLGISKRTIDLHTQQLFTDHNCHSLVKLIRTLEAKELL